MNHSHKKEIVWLLGPSCIVFTTKVEHTRAAVQDVHAFQNIMAGVSKDFVSGDHYDTLLTLLDEDLLNADEDFTAEIANVVTKIGDLPSTQFKCDVCEKMCKSQQDLSRHKNAKHISSHSHAHSSTEVRDAELILDHLAFQQFINECAKKLWDRSQLTSTYFWGFPPPHVNLCQLWCTPLPPS